MTDPKRFRNEQGGRKLLFSCALMLRHLRRKKVKTVFNLDMEEVQSSQASLDNKMHDEIGQKMMLRKKDRL